MIRDSVRRLGEDYSKLKEGAYSATSFLDHTCSSPSDSAVCSVLCATHRMQILISFGQSKGAGDTTGILVRLK